MVRSPLNSQEGSRSLTIFPDLMSLTPWTRAPHEGTIRAGQTAVQQRHERRPGKPDGRALVPPDDDAEDGGDRRTAPGIATGRSARVSQRWSSFFDTSIPSSSA